MTPATSIKHTGRLFPCQVSCASKVRKAPQKPRQATHLAKASCARNDFLVKIYACKPPGNWNWKRGLLDFVRWMPIDLSEAEEEAAVCEYARYWSVERPEVSGEVWKAWPTEEAALAHFRRRIKGRVQVRMDEKGTIWPDVVKAADKLYARGGRVEKKNNGAWHAIAQKGYRAPGLRWVVCLVCELQKWHRGRNGNVKPFALASNYLSEELQKHGWKVDQPKAWTYLNRLVLDGILNKTFQGSKGVPNRYVLVWIPV